jgi:hypothetical protein
MLEIAILFSAILLSLVSSACAQMSTYQEREASGGNNLG